ncbi:MAG: transcription-repair coupling factor [Gammaproteobacteria bacterium]|nr:transcription-repair coupling factor [Gammaproteobacteria bacterium]
MDDRSRLSPLAPVPPAPGERLSYWTQLFGAARSLAIAETARRHAGLTVLVCTESAAAVQYGLELPFFAPEIPILHLPDWETLAYDRFSPFQDIISERMTTLASLDQPRHACLIISVATLLQRLAPRQWVQGQSFVLKVGDDLDRDKFRRRLQEAGYRYMPQVTDHGDFAIRGSLIDVFPMGAEQPFRIDLLGDEIESLRLFDVETQRSTTQVPSIELLPAREVPLTEDGIATFRRNWRLSFDGRPSASPIFEDVSSGLAPPGIEYYLPLFFESVSTLFDYLPEQTLFLLDGVLSSAAESFMQSVESRYEQLRHDIERPLLPPARLFLSWEDALAQLAHFPRVALGGEEWTERARGQRFASRPATRQPIDIRAKEPLATVQEYVARFEGRVLLLAESTGRRETIAELFARHNLPLKLFGTWAEFLHSDAPLGLAVGPLAEGAEIQTPPLSLITESQLFGERAAQRRRRRRSNVELDAIVRNLAELRVGAPVVHEQHGIGRYLGLEVLTAAGITNEFIKLEYADGDKIYIPVASLGLISRYTSIDPDHAPLHKLGSGQWDKARRRAAEKIRDVAAELLEIHAKRASRIGHAFGFERDAYLSFEQGFPFEETPDQQAAIEAVVEDMQKPQPMDRLICGDVGFGKTEVAMRAAFIAVGDGRQVAVLVPTTLLAQQHYQTFRDRFADWPVKIEQLSRFRDAQSIRVAQAGLVDGTVDIIIGTHKLLSRDLKFKNLGLVIIDEEHRFGVRQKEQLKAMRTEVDILTLTATPIPRTLNLALAGTRELSVIATAPSKRLAVKTFIHEWSDELIREAVLREIARGGQVYFVHNEVDTIDRLTTEIAHLVPEARVQFAHGQMRERDLEHVMLDFYHRRCNVLVCTTIIETGIDIPNANTMIINRADKFGLAQLYQLRGRVGRSHHRAYAYLISPPRKAITGDAVKRLEAIEALEELGVGFTLATHDMEIRGAGEILGAEQSGHIQEIGFGLYADLLNRAVAALKAGRQPSIDDPGPRATEIELHVPALLPEDYLPDVHARLVLYKRIASVADESELESLKEELVDRFGTFETPVHNLFRITRLKLAAASLDVKRVDLGRSGGVVEFKPHPNIDPAKVIKLIQSNAAYRLDGQEKLRLKKDLPDAPSRFNELEALFGRLA